QTIKFYNSLNDTMEYLKDLNLQQKKAVLESHRLICVIAGPGCGKTKTLISRIIYLLMEKKTKLQRILLLIFAKKAIKEIKKIVYNFNYQADQKEISTILSLISH